MGNVSVPRPVSDRPLGSISWLKCVGRINSTNLCGHWCFQHVGRAERGKPALTVESTHPRSPRYIRLDGDLAFSFVVVLVRMPLSALQGPTGAFCPPTAPGRSRRAATRADRGMLQ